MKIILEITNPDARVSTRDMKDELRTIDITQFDGDIEDMLTYMEDLCTVIIVEGEEHNDFVLDLLNALRTVQDKSFLHALEGMQDQRDSGHSMTAEKIILLATRKYYNLVQRNSYQHSNSKKYLNFTTDEGDNKDAIAEWRKLKIPGQSIVERDGHTFHWCPRHKVPSRSFPNGLYVCSHKPENHDAWAAKNNRPKKGSTTPKDDSSSPSVNNKQLVMTDKLRRVLTTTQPNLSAT